MLSTLILILFFLIISPHGARLIQQLIAVGKLTTAVMNLLKCEGPEQELDILNNAKTISQTAAIDENETKQEESSSTDTSLKDSILRYISTPL